jgi:hypothetical protein
MLPLTHCTSVTTSIVLESPDDDDPLPDDPLPDDPLESENPLPDDPLDDGGPLDDDPLDDGDPLPDDPLDDGGPLEDDPLDDGGPLEDDPLDDGGPLDDDEIEPSQSQLKTCRILQKGSPEESWGSSIASMIEPTGSAKSMPRCFTRLKTRTLFDTSNSSTGSAPSISWT